MTAQQHKAQLTQEISTQLKTIKIPAEVAPYIWHYIEECSLHQLQNLSNNMIEVKKFITHTIAAGLK